MKNKIIEVLSRTFEIKVNENTNQKNCEAWDSLKHLNMVIELEDEFDISFEPDEISQMKSVSEIAQIISSKLK